MKTMKKALAILLSVLMVMSMTVAAVATTTTTTHTIKIKNNVEGYQYTAYQIFKGNFNEDKTILSNITWGDGIDGTALLAALTANDSPLKELFAGVTTAQGVAEVLAGDAFGNDTDNTIAFAKLAADCTKGDGYSSGTTLVGNGADAHYEIKNVPDGYYLVKNANNGIPNDGAYTSIILEVVGKDAEVIHKAKAPTLDKKIKDDQGNWGNVDDSEIGDTVDFRIVTSVPNTMGYDEYTYIIHDKLSDGLTFDKSTVELYSDANKEHPISTDYYSVKTLIDNENELTAHEDGSKCTFIIDIDILKLIDKDTYVKSGTGNIYTFYSATLNDKAMVYGDAEKNNNTARLEFSNNPMDETSKDKTPEVTVYEWTFKINVDKVDAANEGTKLKGAKFVLSETGTMQNANGTFKEADLGTVTDGVPTRTDKLIQFVKKGNTYTVYDGETALAEGETLTYVIETDETGNVDIKGLDDSTYYLYETKAPDGYNLLKQPYKVIVDATYKDNGRNVDTFTINGEAKDTVKVENKQGSALPETGGIGTTIFYVVGGAMMFVAVVLLVTKKKMSKNNK